VDRRRVLVRRGIGVGAVLVLLGIGAGLAIGLTRGSGGTAAPVTTIAAPKPFRVIFPEGFTRLEMAHRVQVVAGIAHRERGVHPLLSRTTYLAASGPRRIPGFGAGRRPLEGFLFPATYDFITTTTSRQLVNAQLAAFHRNWSTVDLAYARKKNLTSYDVLIIASLVEKEALAPDERAKIARVIYNRLHARMNLGIDASTRYGLNVPGTQPLRQSQLDSFNPYNTRNPRITGLPPTPIANPGLASIQAAAHPAPGDWLYFVRKPDRIHHYFTASYQDFLRHEQLYGFK
ncbi:MAG TPA: endolytic transglycosylase MltG, partial [Gaiellaceae bacterium]|nr:endolytic transglycosylase MltG [Gaiellaceae bacterium]